MSVAYIALAHRAPEQVAQLAERVCTPEDRMYVHLDRRVAAGEFDDALTRARADVKLTRRRFRSRWASFALVDATLAAVEQALEENPDASHVCLLSGDSVPLVPPRTLSDFFTRAGERSFMFSADGSQNERPDRSANATWYWNGDLRRVTYRHYQLGNRQIHFPNRFLPQVPRLTPPGDLDFLHGSQWWALSRQAARLAVESFIRRPALRRYFRRVQAPDEWAFQMVLGNSPLADTIVNDDLHFIRWDGWHAATLGVDDLPQMARSPKLFARKVDSGDAEMALGLDGLLAARHDDAGATLSRVSAELL